jgi:acyl carrier protein
VADRTIAHEEIKMAKTIASRTPEGQPNRCPLCGASIVLEPSSPSGDAPCPRCGTLLWFLRTSENIIFFEADAIADIRLQIFSAIGANLGVDPRQTNEGTHFDSANLDIDSLDLVELVMELEEQFETVIAETDLEKIKTFGDLIDYILRRRYEK